MEYIIIITMIYIISSIIAIKLQKRIEETTPIAVVGIILVVYIFGLFNNLALGVIFLKLSTIILLIYFIKLIIKNIKNKKGKETIKQILTPGVLIYVLLVILFIIENQNRIFEMYDTFNHWGLTVKNMCLYNDYGTTGNIIQFNEYPPFTGTFQYILVNLSGEYSESTIITAQCILYLSMIMPIFKNIRWDKSLAKSIIIIPMVICLPLIFYDNFYTEILIDGFIGVLLALSMYQVYKKDKILLTTYLIALTLTKNIGILLTIMVLIVDTIMQITSKSELGKEKTKKELKKIGITAIIILIICGSWYTKITIDHSNLNWGEIGKESYTTEEKIQIIQQFANELKNGTKKITEKGLSVLTCFAIYLSLAILIYNKDKNKDKLKIQIAMAIIMIIYIISMLYPYILLFNEEEARMLASFSRYMSSILLSGFFLNMLIAFEKIKKEYIIYVITILMLFLPFESIQHKYIYIDNYNDMARYKREKYGQIKNFVSILKENDKIYLVADKIFDKYYVTELTEYEIIPAKLGNPEYTATPDNIIEQLKNEYTYIYVLNENEQFSEKTKVEFGQDICEQQNAMYKIIKQGDKIKLERIYLRDILK